MHKVGIVGTGRMGSKYINKFDILGYDAFLVDKEKTQLEQFPSKFRKYTDLDEALEAEKSADAIFVVTSPTSHIPIAQKIIHHGINVMVEKPPALDIYDLEETILLAQKSDIIFGVSEIELKSSAVRNLDISNLDVQAVKAYRLNLGKGYINPFLDLAWHDLYIFYKLFGKFKIEDVKDKKEEKTHLVQVFAKSQRGIPIDLEVAWENSYLKREWVIDTNKGQLVLNFVEDKILYPDGTVVEKDNQDKLELMIEEFVKNPSQKSALRALNILEEFIKFYK
ncbi:MAG: Gfo/Idh/MocA family oxidoreductase [Aquificae bacterium]|nr:Gfo/Idh/MocA family oxidoreductase [Aquificota bacterium]